MKTLPWIVISLVFVVACFGEEGNNGPTPVFRSEDMLAVPVAELRQVGVRYEDYISEIILTTAADVKRMVRDYGERNKSIAEGPEDRGDIPCVNIVSVGRLMANSPTVLWSKSFDKSREEQEPARPGTSTFGWVEEEYYVWDDCIEQSVPQP